MTLDKIFILDNRKTGEDVATERWKKRVEVLYFEYLFPYFKWNDLLRFRRVCKDAKELTDKYIRTKGNQLCPEMTIYERVDNKDKCLARFLELGFPATRIYILNTSGSDMFDEEATNFAKFTEESGPGSKITQVRIRFLNKWLRGNEKKFFEGLPNLVNLLVDEFGGQVLYGGEYVDMGGLAHVQWPERFKQLKKVTIGVRPNVISMDLIYLSRSLIEYCLELDYAADGFASATRLTFPITTHTVLSLAFEMVRKWIEERGAKNLLKPNLKYYDFGNYYQCPVVKDKLVEFYNSPAFIELVITCVKHSVKLLNVDSAWLQKWQPNLLLSNVVGLMHSEPIDCRSMSIPVVSMINLHGLVIPMTMPNLEKLFIPATSKCSLVPDIWLRDRKPWPALKTLDVTVDSKMLYDAVLSHNDSASETVSVKPETTASLIHFLFVGIRRAAMTEVSLAFVEGVGVDDMTIKAATSLGVSCPNLKKLTLVNWPGTNATLIRILGDISALEELCVDGCEKIGNLAFIQTDTTDGLLKQHPGLKKLSLKQLDTMPKLTDKVFQDVLSRMNLTHLVLSSKKPLTNITPAAIMSLKNGEFANTIEKFSFTDWSLADVNMKTFKEMEKEFRSCDMI